ncbi:IPT/TIG domain-containing protein [Streptomyces sp. NPDC005336]|uniref:IPT/TIG domain-containing protein n=1 Tax=Streptomyces sp. NPDC005336 TaxID=3157035 RepID=UPI0033B22A24
MPKRPPSPTVRFREHARVEPARSRPLPDTALSEPWSPVAGAGVGGGGNKGHVDRSDPLFGTVLTTTSAVLFETAPAPFTVVSDSWVTAIAPAGPAGPVTVKVTTPGGGTSNGLVYTRVAPPGIQALARPPHRSAVAGPRTAGAAHSSAGGAGGGGAALVHPEAGGGDLRREMADDPAQLLLPPLLEFR